MGRYRMKTAARNAALIVAVAAILTVACLGFAWAASDGDSGQSGSASVSGNDKALTIDDFAEARAAIMTGCVQETVLRQYLPDERIQLFKTHADSAMAVSSAKADFTVVVELVAKKLQQEYPNLAIAQFEELVGYNSFALAKGGLSTQLGQEINAYIQRVSADGTLDKMKDVWFGDDESLKVMGDPEALPNVNGVIRVATRSDNEPYSYMKDGVFIGYEMDILLRFAQQYGYALEFTATEFDSLILMVKSGKVDLIAGNISATPERAESVDFTDPISKTDYYFLYNGTYFEGGSTPLDDSENAFLASFKKTFVTEGRWQLILSGLGVTLLITIGAAILGTALGFGFALMRRYCGRGINKAVDIYVGIFEGTPILVMLLIFYYVIFGKVDISAVLIGIIVFGLNAAAFISENLNSCLAAVDPGQREAALASGYTERQAFLHFVLPIAVRRMLPVYRGELTSLLKNTSIVGYVALIDLTKAGDIIRSRTYEALFPLLTVAAIYLLMAWVISLLLRKIEKKLLGTRPKTSIKGVTLR